MFAKMIINIILSIIVLCTIEQLTKDGNKVRHSEVVTVAKYSHIQRIMCPLPKIAIDDNYFTIGYEMTASNDRNQFSDMKHLAVYDSKCMQCNAELECTQSVSTKIYFDLCLSFF